MIILNRRSLLSGLILAFVAAFLNTNSSFAVIAETSSIYQKAFYSGVIKCFNTNGGTGGNSIGDGGLRDEITLSQFGGANSLLLNKTTSIVPILGKSGNNITCYNLLTTKTEKKLQNSVSDDMSVRAQSLADAGYEADGPGQGNNGKRCYSYKYKRYTTTGGFFNQKYVGEDEFYTPLLCIKREGGGISLEVEEIANQYDTIVNQVGSTLNNKPISFDTSLGNAVNVGVETDDYWGIFYTGYSTKKKKVDLAQKNDAKIFADIGNAIIELLGSSNDNSSLHRDGYDLNVDRYDSAGTLSDALIHRYYSACAGFESSEDGSQLICNNDSPSSGQVYSVDFKSQVSSGERYKKLETKNNNTNRNIVVSKYSNGKYDYDGIALDDDEIYRLYYYYLTDKDYYNVERYTCGNGELYGVGDYHARLWWKEENKYSEYCYFNVKASDVNVNGVDGDHYFGTEVGLDEIITTLKSLKNEASPGSGAGLTDYYNDDQDACYSGSGALGWIVCPVIEMATGLGETMWNQIENYHMKIPAANVFTPNGGVERGWRAIQIIANIVFIILFLVVIFSQLTGYGIDNYGIKKILPRLIVIAILVNLSYVICELAVDLSNIIGIGLNNLFSQWAGYVSPGLSGASVGSVIGAGIFDVGIGVGGVFLFELIQTGSWQGALAGIGLAALGIIIVIVAAMLTLYLILVAREAGIVLSIIIAPAAIVCYALPNTEKLGKKWFDLFKALMVVYPICGAVIGAGQIAGTVLASIDNPGMKIAAMVVQVLPYFFIPLLLKNSLSLMGNVGAKISSYGRSLGQRASKGAQGMIQNTERYKNWSQEQKQEQKEAAEERRARRVREGVRIFGRQVGGLAGQNVDNLSEKQRARLNRANEIMKAAENRRLQANVGADEDVYRAEIRRLQHQSGQDREDKLLQGEQNVIVADTIKAENTRTERRAEAGVGVLQLDNAIATGRAQSRREAQELRAYQDQFAGFNKTLLRGEVVTAGTWLNDPDGNQRMSALISAMEANGMEDEIYNMLRNNDVSERASVMQALAGSKNYLLQAYGKKGESKDFTTFETGGELQEYIEKNGLGNADKDSLEEINSRAPTTTISGVISDTVAVDMLMKAANNAQIPKVREQMNGLLYKVIGRMGSINDLAQLKLSPEDFALMHDDTAKKIKEAVMAKFGLAEPDAKLQLQGVFGTQIGEARSNERITSRVSRGTDSVGEIFGIF